MKIICTQENLRNGLSAVSRIISNSNTLPILNNVLLKTENGLLNLTATNLELAVTTMVRCKIEEEGSVCLVSKTFAELVNNLPTGNITIESKDSEVVISTEHYNNKIKTLPSEEFPSIPVVDNGQKLTFDGIQLKQSLDSVVFAASTSETQPEISGVLLTKDDSGVVKFVATDRYRLAEKTIGGQASSVKNVIIPNKTAQELSRLLTNQSDPVEVIITDNQISVTTVDTTVISRLIDGQYPDYQQIIPQDFNATVNVDKRELANALKTSGIFSRGTGSVVMKFDSEQQKLQVEASSQDIGQSSVDLAAEVSGEAGSIILNYRYVLDALTAMSSPSVVIKIVNEGSPVIFQPQDDNTYTYLVMPIKS